jgi:hypothetical protein
MTLSPAANITSFPRAHEFHPVSFAISREQVRAYTAAVGDSNDYGDTIPPLAALALALEALQHEVRLPEGSLHTGQEVEHEATVLVERPLTLSGRVAQRSERQGYVITVLELEISAGGSVAIRARSTIMAPADAA